ncbi:hypothetical protein POWCR01_000011800 [Plasmodium ovale]|uniref:PIR protein n=1 Tax=Plasmodium ovale TaxID=36330 RepID=A0A1C3KEY6_PLAOA|nr:hypothetical protein POWCR01_000011800 [Plasmodium ovale]
MTGDGHYDNFLHKTDQALRNISMYLIENYKGDYESCRIQDSGTQCKDRCKFLNIWLNEKKSIYTSNGKCTFYNKLWEDYVENLWKKIDESIENPYKCQRDLNSSGNNFPEDKFSQYCNLSPSEVSLLTCPDKAYFSNMWNRIKSIIKRKLRIGDNTDEQDNYELLRNDENETMSSINSMYNITYNTPRN